MGHGQSSHRCHSLTCPSAIDHDDRLSLFVPYSPDSTASLSPGLIDRRVDDLLASHYYSGSATNSRNHSKSCRQLSKLKKSFSECFRSNFHRLKEEVDSDFDALCHEDNHENEVHRQPCSDTSANNVQVTDNRVRRFSDSSSSGTHSLPRDILEIHMKLKELKQLLSRPDIVSDSVEKRDKCCQTSSSALQESHDRTLRQKDSFIAHQKDQMTKLRAFLERRTKLTECLSKELSVLKSSSQQSRRACIDPTESRILDQFVTLLKSIRSDISLRQSDLDRFDEGLSLLNALLSSSRHQVVDKANVAVVTPCANSTRDEPCPPSQAISNQRNTLSQYNARREESHTKMMVYFQGNSLNPYQSVIPLPLSRITLLDVKQSTKSLLSNDVKFRYFFNTINSDFGPTKQEISADEDKVPGINGKIIVFIQQ